ncbi:MAG: hypothetical protein K8J31_10485, partial [Anaerolineae bacterium]|nr:hypothetical protein [Anaerolineae bacterium]
MNERHLLWLIAAVVTGLLVASQSVALLIIGVAGVAFVVLSAITPLAALMFLLILAPLRTLVATEANFPLPLDIGQLLLMAFLAVWILQQ